MAVFPFSEEGKFAFEAEWRALFSHLGDGIVGDLTGNAFRVTAAGDGRIVRIAATPPGVAAKVQGFGYTTPSAVSPVSLNLSTVGSQPTGTQQRTDVAVLRLDMATKNITALIEPGAPAALPSRPALRTDPDGQFDLPLASWTVGTQAITQALVKDERAWLGPRILTATDALLPNTAMLGMSARWRNTDYYRVLDAQGNPVWSPLVQTLDYTPQWVAVTGATSVGTGGVIRGSYTSVGGGLVRWSFLLSMAIGAGGGPPTAGNFWHFTLPTPAKIRHPQDNIIGTGQILKNGRFLSCAAHRHSGIANAFVVVIDGEQFQAGSFVPAVGWQPGDQIRLSGTYEMEI